MDKMVSKLLGDRSVSFEISEEWKSKDGSKWIAEVQVKIVSLRKSGLLRKLRPTQWGDLIWFFVCSSNQTEDEIMKNEIFDISPGRYICQDILNKESIEEYLQQKLIEVSGLGDAEAAIALEKYFYFD